jgi:hypothetical protein
MRFAYLSSMVEPLTRDAVAAFFYWNVCACDFDSADGVGYTMVEVGDNAPCQAEPCISLFIPNINMFAVSK